VKRELVQGKGYRSPLCLAANDDGRKLGIIQRQREPPALHFLQKLHAYFGCAAFPLGGGVLVKSRGPDGFARKHVPQLAPTVGVFVEAEVLDSGMARLVAWTGARGAILTAEFLKVGENGQGELTAITVSTKLEGGGGVRADVDAAPLGFGVKLRQEADAKGVIRGLLLTFHVQAVFWNDFLVLRRGAGLVVHVPAQGFKEGVNQPLADLGFVAGEKCLLVGPEVPAQLRNFLFALLKRLGHAYLFPRLTLV